MNPLRRHHGLLTACAVLLISASSKCQPAATGSLRGSVYLADTGLPAVGTDASLIPSPDPNLLKIDPQSGEYVLRDHPNFSAKVDAAGSFQIHSIGPGDYFVLTTRPGYLSQREYIYPGALSPEFNPGQNLPAFVRKIHVTAGKTEQIRLFLERGGAIEGTVSFPDLQPQGNRAGIAVNLEIKTRDGKFVRALGAAHTDADGRFRLDGLPPASYVVFAALPGEMRPAAGGDRASGGEIIFCCNSVRASRARVVEIRGKESYSGLDFNLQTAGLHTVSGRVVKPSGAPFRDGLVRLYPTGEPGLSRTVPIQADGKFLFDQVPDEEYTLAVESERQAELVGPTPDGSGIIMRLAKPAFLPAEQAIQVSGQDPPAVLFKVQTTQP